MAESKEKIKFPFVKPPSSGTVKEVFDGVFWAQMRLPMLIDHVNVYILEGENDLTIIDTGINALGCRTAWLEIIEKNFSSKPINKL